MAKFYTGQKVRITDNTNGHFHEIGEVVTLASAKLLKPENNYYDLSSEEWYFDSDDCEPVEEAN